MLAPMQATVHIVDDDPALRKGLSRLCRAMGLDAVEHADANALQETASGRRPACVVLDVRLAEQNGIAVQETLREAGFSLPIIFLTGYGTIPMTVRAMRGGAIEFLTKPIEDEILLEAIGRALDFDREQLAAGRATDELTTRYATLTQREREVMSCTIGGLMNKQIAAELGLSEITAKVHKRRVMEKMSARSLPDLVRMADTLGLIARRHR